MMLPFLMAATLNAAAAQPVITTDQLPNLFVAACLDGSARLSGGDATPIPFGALPEALRSRLGNPSAAKVWKLRGGNAAYLYLLEFAGKGVDPRICGLAAENLALRPATDVVAARIRGYVAPAGSARSTEWYKPDQGYRALTTREGGFTILQINWVESGPAEVSTSQ